MLSDLPETLTVETFRQSPSGQQPIFSRGACLGRYVVLEAIGSGGMGNVFAAYDPELDRKVAIKILHRHLLISAAREAAQVRLRREARAVARLAHPNVVSVFDIGTVGKCLFVAMELIDGQSLASWLAQKPRSWRQILDVFKQAGQGLAAAHRAGIVHRDFKPSNVMVARDGRVCVVDFGLAKTSIGQSIHEKAIDANASSASSHPLLDSTPILGASGTPAYMAPEQLAGGPIDAGADQFSFCVALYQALFGELPGSADIDGDASQLRSDSKASKPVLGLAVPSHIREVVQRGLSVDPATRYPTMVDLLTDLVEEPVRRQSRPLRRQGRLVTAFLIAAVLGLGLSDGYMASYLMPMLSEKWKAYAEQQLKPGLY